jgi:serine/threonine protein kinase
VKKDFKSIFVCADSMADTKRRLWGEESGDAKRRRPDAKKSVGAVPTVNSIGLSMKQKLDAPNRAKREVTIYKTEGKVFKSVKAPGKGARALYDLYKKQHDEGPCPTRAQVFYASVEPPTSASSRFWTVDIWMELAEGVKLTANSLTVDRAQEIFDNTVNTAKWLGDHNDLKPDNFFIANHNIVKAIDFGHAIYQKGDPDQDTGDLSFYTKHTRDTLLEMRADVGENWDELNLAVVLFHYGAGVALEDVLSFERFAHKPSREFEQLDMEMPDICADFGEPDSVRRGLLFD